MGCSKSKLENMEWGRPHPTELDEPRGPATQRPVPSRVVEWNPLPEKSSVNWPSLNKNRVIAVQPILEEDERKDEEEREKQRKKDEKRAAKEAKRTAKEAEKEAKNEGKKQGFFSKRTRMVEEDGASNPIFHTSDPVHEIREHRPPVIPAASFSRKTEPVKQFPSFSQNSRMNNKLPGVPSTSYGPPSVNSSVVKTNDVVRHMRHFVQLQNTGQDDEDGEETDPTLMSSQSPRDASTSTTVKKSPRPTAAKGGKDGKAFIGVASRGMAQEAAATGGVRQGDLLLEDLDDF